MADTAQRRITDEHGRDEMGISWADARRHVRSVGHMKGSEASEVLEIFARETGLLPYQFVQMSREDLAALKKGAEAAVRERAGDAGAGEGV
ncbi:hypothetical protein [Streptomyces noursei]